MLRILAVYHGVLAVFVWSLIPEYASNRSINQAPVYWVFRYGLLCAILSWWFYSARNNSTRAAWVLSVTAIIRLLVALFIQSMAGSAGQWLVLPLSIDCGLVGIMCAYGLFRLKVEANGQNRDVRFAGLSGASTACVALATTMFGVKGLGSYGLSLFVLTPFFMGALAAFLTASESKSTMGDC